MRLFVGLDVSSFDMKGCVLDQDGARLDSFSVTNDLPGISELKDRLLDFIVEKEIDNLKIGLESTSVYSFHPSMYLHHDDELKKH
ncbi:IS110 family transposase, partial [Salipaludibacillus sp. CUR1]|uniref:IS110 family transposase n=1 Tax=Salipaludibacillus sp. CUR1 TaxID=2820003 RepID=UPI001E28320F